MRHILVPLAFTAVAACQQPAENAEDHSAWAGKWSGPEGTSLVIEPAGEAFTVKITDLDRTRIYAGTPTADGIVIERGREPLTIRAGSGDETGMKWLAGKTDCLVVDANEGYCRD